MSVAPVPASSLSDVAHSGERRGNVTESKKSKAAFTEEDGSFFYNDASHVFKDMRGSKTRLRDKISFFLGVFNCLFTAWCTGGHQWMLPLFYAVKAPVLIFMRLIMYWKSNDQYFLLDFCYFGNLLLIGYLTFFRDSPFVFTVVFALTHGPLVWAVVTFRNSLVFHSLDKITSVFIHVTPSIVLWCIKWHGAEMLRDAPAALRFEYEFCQHDDIRGCQTPFYIFVLPMLLFLAHQVFYLLCVGCLCPIQDRPIMMTSYRYLLKKLMKKEQYKYLVEKIPRKFRFIAFGLISIVYTLITVLPVPWLMASYFLHTAYLIIILGVIIWNGANFYVDVFPFQYMERVSIKKVPPPP